MRKISTVALIIGVVMLLVGIFLPIIFMQIYTAQNGSIGIIGGADGPTAIYLTQRLFGNSLLILKLFGGAITLSGLFCSIFGRTVKENCTLKTSGISLGLSVVISLGVYCVVAFISCFVMTHPNKHPITYITSIILGLLCLALFVLLLYLYVKQRKVAPSVIGVIIDILFAIIYLTPFFFTYAWAHSIVSSWLK